VQVSLTAAGVKCPRDSDMQEKALGSALPLDAKFRRGDLLFWPGHVAIVRDADTIVHANAFAMATALEPLKDALARIEQAGSRLRTVKRF
jgi:cell wall-associated NlpC family hydrolase